MVENARRPLQPADLVDLTFLGDVQLSPDGSQIFYEISKVQVEQNSYSGEIYQLDINTKISRKLTAGSRRDSTPRLSPDGKKLAFLSDRGNDNKKQIYLLDLQGPGEALRLTNFQSGVAGFAWSPNNQHLAVLVETPDEPKKAVNWSKLETAEARREREANEQEARRINGALVTFSQHKMRADGRRSLIPPDAHVQLWLVDSAEANPQPRQLTDGAFNVAYPAFSPDGKQLVFSSVRDQNQADFTCVSDLWLLDLFSADLTLTKLTKSAGPGTHGAFSPDGKKLAFVGHTNPLDGSFLETSRVWALDLTTPDNDAVCLSTNFDYPVASLLNTDLRAFSEFGLAWSADSSQVYFPATVGGSLQVLAVPADASAEPQALTPTNRHVFSYNFAAQAGLMVFGAYSPTNPGDIFIQTVEAGLKGEPAQQLTELNQGWLKDKYIAEPETLKIPSADGKVTIEGWLLKPPGFDPAKKYPMVTLVHGGPHTAYGFSFFIEFQLHASNGFLVLYTNPRGSVGYGYDFAAAIRNDWGNHDYNDVMSAVDYVLARGYADPERLGLGGGSYGGYMANWVATHTDRFKQIVSERCVSNLVTMYTLSDIGPGFIESEFDGNPWTNRLVWERSPIAHANKKVGAKVLFLHSEADYRCPIEQAEEMYFALKHFGSDVLLVRTPNEDHNLSRSGSPAHRVERLRQIQAWFAPLLEQPSK